ncbi:tetratricopeptide repeat protein [Candidatus Sumerlaeota bacterium]|nr:tetratricopeptide repeat protein [Candidatus Sumerlaeota bacterium]
MAQLELADLVRRTPTRQQEATDLYGQGIELAIKDPTLLDKKDLLRYRNEYAEIHLSSQKYRESAKLFWTVIENDPAGLYYKAPDSIIRAYLSIGPDLVPDTPENKEAISILVKIIEKRPTEDKAHYMLGKIYFDRNDYPKAIGYLDQALKNMGGGFGAPNFADCHYYLALAYRRTDKLEDAIKLLRALLEIQPARYEAICELAEIYFDLSDYNNAIGQFRRGVNVEPSNYRAYIGAGRTLRRIEKYNEAIVMYEQLIKLKDDNYHYFFEMGLTYTALNRHERARDTYLKVIEMVGKSTDPNAAETRSMLGDVYTYLAIANLALKKYNESLEQLDKALTYHDNYGKALEAKGLAYRELGQLAQAEDFFNKALTTDPKRPEFYLNLGVLNHKFKKDTQTALTFYQKYYENGGADPQVAEWIRECGGTPPK